MADYYPLIARAVAGLEKNTGDARRSLYERARSALVAQLRGVTPALSESDVTRERLALEEAIRKVEAEAARQTRVDSSRADLKIKPPEFPRWEEPAAAAATPAPAPSFSPRKSTALPARQAAPLARGGAATQPATMFGEQRYVDPVFDPPVGAPVESTAQALRGGRARASERRSVLDTGLKDFREVVSEADDLGEATARSAKSARDMSLRDASARDAFAPLPASRNLDRSQRQAAELQELDAPVDEFHEEDLLEQPYVADDVEPAAPQRHPVYRAGGRAGAGRSYGDLIKVGAAIVGVACVAGVLVWQWPNMVALYRMIRVPAAEATKEQPPSRTKITDRIEPGGQTTAPPVAPPGAAVAQRVVLYEEDPAEPQGKQFVGSAVWRTETVSPGPRQAPELAIRADVTVPDKQLSIAWVLRRNTDKSLPASHTIEITFKLPNDFAPGGVDNIPGILMKSAEQTRGIPLAGSSAKVTKDYFLIGLSALDADKDRNIQLLKERAWIDIPIVYSNRRRAILAIDKGTAGERVFEQAFASWGTK